MMKNQTTYTVRVQREFLEWVDISVKAPTPQEAERIAKRQALKATTWQRVQTARPFRTRIVLPPSDQGA